MDEEPIFICSMCNSGTFKTFKTLSDHLETNHQPNSGNSLLKHNSLKNNCFPTHNTTIPELKSKRFGNYLAFNESVSNKLSQQNIHNFHNSNCNEISTFQIENSENFVIKFKETASEFNNSQSLLDRKKSTNYKCPECGKILSSAHNLERHKLIHVPHKNFVCEFCGLSFKREDNLKDHRCIVNEDGLTARIKRTKNQEEIVNGQVALVCPICGKSFANISNLNKHSKIHDEKKEICGECGKQFHLKTSLRDHITQIHEGGKMLTCPVCEKQLKGRNSLFTHLVRFHPEQKNRVGPPKHTCPDCGRVFYQSGNLRKHQLTHSEVLSYVCSTCKTAFRFPEQLRRHRLKHESNRRFSCVMCDKAFIMEYELKNHIEIYHGGMLYVCKYCSLSCKHLQAFRRHLQRLHPDKDWQKEGPAFFKASRISNTHYVNIKTSKVANVETQSRSDTDSLGEVTRDSGSTGQALLETPESQEQSQISPDIVTLSYLTAEQLSSLESFEEKLISLTSTTSGTENHGLSYCSAQSQNTAAKIQLHDIVEDQFDEGVAMRDSSQSSFSTQISDPVSFDPSMIAQTPSGVFKEEQESLMSTSLANLAEFISFPTSDLNPSGSPYMVGLDE